MASMRTCSAMPLSVHMLLPNKAFNSGQESAGLNRRHAPDSAPCTATLPINAVRTEEKKTWGLGGIWFEGNAQRKCLNLRNDHHGLRMSVPCALCGNQTEVALWKIGFGAGPRESVRRGNQH